MHKIEYGTYAFFTNANHGNSIGTMELHLQEQNITNLPTLSKELKYLNCSGTRIACLPNLPKSLERLVCSYTQITYLPELPNSLKWLDCNNTQITRLPKLPDSLSRLECCNTNIKSLPKLPSKLCVLHCSGVRLTSLPKRPKKHLGFCGELTLCLHPDETIPFPFSIMDWDDCREVLKNIAKCRRLSRRIRDELADACEN